MKYISVAFITLCALTSLFIHVCHADSNITVASIGNKTRNLLELSPTLYENFLWARKAISRALVMATEDEGIVNLNITNSCRKHLFKTMLGLRRLELWAIQMLDASGKLPNGILSGMIYSYGDFDGCLSINARNEFRGKYCVIQISPNEEVLLAFYNMYKDSLTPDRLMERATKLLSKMTTSAGKGIRTSVCVPSTCSKNDVQNIVNTAVQNIDIGIKFTIANCEVEEPVQFERREIISIFILSLAVFLFVLGTITEICLATVTKDESYKTNSGALVRFVLCFSGYTNSKQLLQVSKSGETQQVFNFLKFGCASQVTLMHCYVILTTSLISGPLMNSRNFLKQPLYYGLLNIHETLSGFFFMSAYHLGYNTAKRGGEDFPVHTKIFRRFFRLVPPSLMIIVVSFIVPKLGSGPVWRESMHVAFSACPGYWWANILIINNYISTDKSCLPWTWYVAAEMHLHILFVFLLEIIKRFPRSRNAMFLLIVATSLSVFIANSLYYNFTFENFIKASLDYSTGADYFRYNMLTSHLYIFPYCIGVAMGYVMYGRTKKISIPPRVSILVWPTSMILVTICVIGAYDWMQGNFPSFAVYTLYRCSYKIIYTLGIAWFIFFFSSNWNPFSRTGPSKENTEKKSGYSYSVLATLGRLSYMAYLLHPIIEIMYAAAARNLLYVDHRTGSFLFFGSLVIVFATSLPFYLFFEAPFLALDNFMFPRKQLKSNSASNGWSTKEIPTTIYGDVKLTVNSENSAA